MRSFFLSLLVLVVSLVSSLARADTYVVEPAFGRSVVGVDVFGGAPIGASGDGSSALGAGGGGSEMMYGYAWEGGLSLYGVFGYARWSSKSAIGDAIGDRQASLVEGYAGLGVRYVLFDASLSPYVQGALAGELLRVRGTSNGDASGAGVAAQVGVRLRDAPWDGFLGLDARHARFEAPLEGGEGVMITRVTLVVGALLDLR